MIFFGLHHSIELQTGSAKIDKQTYVQAIGFEVIDGYILMYIL